MDRRLVLLLLASCSRGVAAGADPTPLPPVVVTATRDPQPAFDVPASIDSVAVGDAGTPGINPSEYLAGVPGLLARDRQNYAQDEQLSIRGFGARSTFGVRGVRLYADGIPATMPDGQGQTSHFSLDSADRIEVLRGPFSALYGNSSGGVIQIFTAEGTAPSELRAGLDGGYWGTYRIGLGARGSDGMLGYNVDLSHFYTDNYRGHGRAERTNGNARLDVRFDDERKLTLLANTLNQPNADDPLGLTRSQFDSDPRQPQPVAVQFDTRKGVRQDQVGAIYEQAFAGDQNLRVLGYYGQRDIEQFQAIPLSVQAKPTSPGGVIDLDGDYAGGDARWSWHGALAQRPFDLSIGLSFDEQNTHRLGYNNFSGNTLGVPGDLRRDEQDDVYNFDQYLQATWDVAEHWLLSAGARHNDVHFQVDDNYITATNGDDSGRVEYSATTPVAGVMFRAGAAWHLYAAYGDGFETPTFNELGYRPDGSSGINYHLIPARSRNGEIGSKLRYGDGAEFDVAVFQAQTRHELAVATSSGGRTTYQNIDRARRRGVEAGLTQPLGHGWRIEAGYTWLEATFRSAFLTCPEATPCTTPDTPVAAGARIPGVPQSDLHAAARYGAATGWNATIEAEAAAKTPVNDLNTQFAPGYGVLNAGVGYALDRGNAHISTFLRLDNAFDHRYVGSVIVNESNGRYYEPAPGRTLFAGVTITWKR